VARTLVATAGDRLALEHRLWTGAADAPDLEVETLNLTEVDAEGRVVATLTFDPDARRAASAEMFERYTRSGADGMPPSVIESVRAVNDHDLERARAALDDDLVFHDHRRTGLGRIEGADAYIASLAALWELSRDGRIDQLYELVVAPHGRVAVNRTSGTNAEGGELESVYVALVQFQGGPITGIELFELEDLDVARARFEELRPDSTRIPPNAASRACDRIAEALVARDWDALRALAGDEFLYDDRSRRALVSGEVEAWIASATFLFSESAARAEHELLGTVGDRIALHHVSWSGASDGPCFELEKLRILEGDAKGALRALILFDPDDRRAACAEAQARFASGEAAAIGGQAPIAALVAALGRHDWEALRGALARDAAICDRRALAIMGEVDREQWIESLRTLADLAPDVDWELSRLLAWNGHGRVGVGRRFGTARDGGPFEDVFVAVLLTHGDLVQRYEFFDVADADRALARFEELCSARIRARPESA
jgi:ketosteroid isomerase-like protein